jgi:hypothetical protein
MKAIFRFRFALLAVLLATVASTGLAQSVSSAVGSIAGVVKDETGAALPGATIVATSEERGARRTAVSDSAGHFVIPQVLPGKYNVDISLTGFSSVTFKDNVIETEKRTELNVTLKLGKTEVSVQVTGEVPIVDRTQTALETRMRQKEFEKMPVGRSYQNLFLNAPGVNLPPGANPNPNVHGALSGNNQFLFDGVDVTDPTTGTFGGNLNFEAIQEVTVYTSGVSAEYGRATGGIINVITKSGSNRLSGSFKAVLTNDEWNAQNTTVRGDTGASLARTKFDHVNPRYDFTLGGPFWKDHVWFFGDYETADTSGAFQSAPISGENFQQITEDRFWAAKLTAQVSSNHSLTFRGNSSPTSGFIVNYGNPAELAAYTGQDQTSQVYAGQWTGVFGNNITGEASYNWNGPSLSADKSFIDVYPVFSATGETSPVASHGAAHFSNANAFYYNGAFFDGFVKRPRQGANAAATYFTELSGNSHSFKAGFDWQGLKSASLFTFQNNQLYIDNSFNFQTRVFSPLSRRDYLAPASATSKGDIFAGYVRDKFEVGKRMFFELGLRYEHQTSNDDISRSTVKSDTWSPRISGSYDITGNGKTLVVGTYGRFYQFLTQGFSDSFNQNAQKASYDNYNWNGTTYVFSNRVLGSGSAVQPNPDLTPPNLDEGTLGIRQQIGNSIGVSLTGIYRHWGGLIDDVVTLDSKGNQTTIYQNYDPAERKFYGIELVFDKRFSQFWNLNFNYTYSRTEGNSFVDTASTLGDNLNSNCRTTVDPTIGTNGVIGCDIVNDGPNKNGRAAYDQAHNLKLLGAYVRTFGRVNVAAGLGGQLVTGLPYTKSRTVNVLIPGTTTNAGPTTTYFYEQRCSDTLPTLYQLDASLETTFTVWQTVELGVKGEVFNFTDVQKARAVTNTTWCNDFSPTASAACTSARAIYGTTTARGSFQPPRNFRLTGLLRF